MCFSLWISFSSRVVKCGSLLHKSHFQEHLQWPFLHPPMYQVPWDDTVLVYRVQKSTLGPRLGHWKRACTSLVYNQPHWLFHHSMECSQPEWYKIDIENFTDEDLIEPTSSLCFFLKVCELYKLCIRRKIDSAFSLRLSPLLSSPGLQHGFGVICDNTFFLWLVTLFVNILSEMGNFSLTFLVKGNIWGYIYMFSGFAYFFVHL